MPRPKSKTASAQALAGLWAIALTAFVIVALYFARGLLIPFALSALLTFLISPLVGRLERWLGRIAAVMLAVGLIFGALGGRRMDGFPAIRRSGDEAARVQGQHCREAACLPAFERGHIQQSF